MRSSKREIVLGLSIGVGLSVVLAGLGQSYVDHQRSWQAQGGIETAKLSALPQPAAPAPADVLEAPSAAQSTAAPNAADGSRGVALPSSHRIEEAAALHEKSAAPAPRPRASRVKSRPAPKRAASRRVEAQPLDGAPFPEKASLSPSESAGLGLDLPL